MFEEAISDEKIVNMHYKTPHGFVAYVDGMDGEVRVLIDKARGYLFVEDIWISDVGFILERLKRREQYKHDFSEDGRYIRICEYERSPRPVREVWVDADQLERLIRRNMTCKYIPGRICRSPCVFWFSPNNKESLCLYKTRATFREFVENLDRYVHDFRSRMMLMVSSTVKFRFEGIDKQESWSDGKTVTYREALKYRLADMSYEVKIDENGTLTATKGWRYFPGVKYTIKIDREGNGVIESITYTDEDWTFDDVELCTLYKHGDLIEAMRCLCYHFDDKIKLIPREEKE